MNQAPFTAAALALVLLLLTGLVAWRGHWLAARVLAKATIAMALAVLPMGLMATGFDTVMIEPGTPRHDVAVGGGLERLLSAAALATPALVIATVLWGRARRHLLGRGDDA